METNNKKMLYGKHWAPHIGDLPAICALPRNLGQWMVSNGDTPPGTTKKNKVVVWFSPQCAACQNSQELFKALTENQDGYKVMFREATAENLQGFGHVQMVPTYNVVQEAPPGSVSVYGAGTRLTSIRNYNLQDLWTFLPSVNPHAATMQRQAGPEVRS
jgi:hypothetical protein